MKEKNLTKYVIYDRDAMEEKRTMELTGSEYARLGIRPRWWVFVLFGAVVLSSFLTLILMISKSNEVHEHEIDMLNHELIINERNNELYCLIGEYALLGDMQVPHDTIVYEFIKQTGAWYPDIIMAQYVIESAHGKSDLAQDANNFFGMRIARSRMTLQSEDKEYKGYGVYRNWQYSILDRVLWDLHVFDTMPTKEEYIKQLGYIYAEAKNYVPTIRKEAEKWRQRDVERIKNEEFKNE